MTTPRTSTLLFLFLISAALLAVLPACQTETTESGQPLPGRLDYAIALHSGAGVISRDIDPEVRDGYLASLEEALTIGRDLLDAGGSSLDAVAYQICAIMEYQGATLQEAARIVIHEKLDEGDGGIVAVDYLGNIALEFSSPGMFRGAANSKGRFEVAIWD